MDPLFIAVVAVAAFLNVYTAFRCFQLRVRRILSSFTPFVIFQLCLNIETFGAFLFVSKFQDSVSTHFTAACIAGPTAAYFSVSLVIFSHTAFVFVNHVKRVDGWRFSTKQVLSIVSMAVFVSFLILSPAIRIATRNTAVITTKKCLDSAQLANDDVINVQVYIWWLDFLHLYIPALIIMAVVSREIMVYIRQANVFTCQSYTRVYTTVTNLLMLLLLALFAILGGRPLYVNELEVPRYVLLRSDMILLAVLCPSQLMILVELEISNEVGGQAAESRGGRLIEDKATCYIQNVNENNGTQNV